MVHSRKGVVLLNMGGPDSLDDVEPFLYRLFSDRDIIKLGPRFLQKPIARFIARKRAPKSKALYEKIGGGSPLKGITMEQARALQAQLVPHGDYRVTVAMRYWQPDAELAITKLLEEGIEEFIVLSLYPHYSRATTGSSMADFSRAQQRLAPMLHCNCITEWPTQKTYIQCLVANIKDGLERFSGDTVEIVYSAHSLPCSFIKEGDPYADQLKSTIRAIEEETGKTGQLGYQSKSGPVEWLAPATDEVLQELSEKGVKNVLVVPISFVSDHIETLYEIDILFKEKAQSLGMQLLSCNSLNSQPLFIQALKELVLAA